MKPKGFSVIIISASSDIGAAMTKRWLARDWKVFGTFRTKSPAAKELMAAGAKLFYCDVSRESSIRAACRELRKACPSWNALILAPGTQEPVGAFAKSNFNKWEESVRVNFTSQMRIVHELLPSRNKKARVGPCVLFFAGGGTNNAPVNYSAYVISKIALIKMCELLDAEVPDTRFAIVGPGWVKTKIHQATLKAPITARPSTNWQARSVPQWKPFLTILSGS
jgi:NAD(P)-dependent dehydrogenase (short-subunit alcohol dehydrogenase family)